VRARLSKGVFMRSVKWVLIAALALFGCGQKSHAVASAPAPAKAAATVNSSQPAKPPAGATLTGAWERWSTLPGGVPNYEVAEFFDNGWMILHNVAGGLNAQYTSSGSSLTITGALIALWPGVITYHIDGSRLIIDRAIMAGVTDHTEWTRVTRAPFFTNVVKDGDIVPTGVPTFTANMTAAVAKNWRADAVPLNLDVQRLPSGDFAIIGEFRSPQDGSGLRVTAGRWGYLLAAFPTVRWGDHALPNEFVDVPNLLQYMHSNGNSGPLLKASLWVWDHGPVWQVTTLEAGNQSKTLFYAADTGKPLPQGQDPQSAYIASYNAQWAAIAAATHRRGGGGVVNPFIGAGAEQGAGPNVGSDAGGGGCDYSDEAACNAAAVGDTWAADRLEEGTSTPEEQDWYSE